VIFWTAYQPAANLDVPYEEVTMNVALRQQAPVRAESPSPPPIPAEVVAGRAASGPPLEGTVRRLGARGFSLDAPLDARPGAFAWVRLELPGGPIRPLVQVVAEREDGLSCRIAHIFPDDRQRLRAHLA